MSVRLAFGRFWASLSTMFYWITNPVWLGGSLTFLAATTWSTYLVSTGAGTTSQPTWNATCCPESKGGRT